MSKLKRIGQNLLGMFVMANSIMVLTTGFILFPEVTRLSDNSLSLLEGQSFSWLIGTWPLWVLLVFMSMAVAMGYFGIKILKGSSPANEAPKANKDTK